MAAAMSAMRASVRPGGSVLRRPSREAVVLTDRAKEQLEKIMQRQGVSPQESALRLGVRKRGCSGMSYTLDWESKADKGPDKLDEVVNVDPPGLQLIIDGRAVMHVIGSTMDFETDQIREEFVFLNPNATGICGCGESFSSDPNPDSN